MKSATIKFALFSLMLLTASFATARTLIDRLYYNLDQVNKTAEVTYETNKSNGPMGAMNYAYYDSFVIPEEVTHENITYTVTSIGKYAFMHSYYATSVTIPKTVVTIGDGAFNNCQRLKDVYLHEESHLQNIGNQAFYACGNLELFVFPNSLLSIGEEAFWYCDNLKHCNLPNGLTSLGKKAFEYCKSIGDVYIPGSLKIIDEYCFSRCENLKTIMFGDGVETINKCAFPGYNDSIPVILPPSIIKIDYSNFKKCNVILLNGNVSFHTEDNTNYYIMDDNVPTISNEQIITSNKKPSNYLIYFFDKELLLSKNHNLVQTDVIQFNDGLEHVSLHYTGYPQGPNRNNMIWEVGEKLKGFGVSYTFQGAEHTDCGEWSGVENIDFKYKDWKFTCPILYDYKIIPVTLSLSIHDVERTYGEDNPKFEIKADGFVGNDNINNALDDVVISTNATKSSEVGLYPVYISAKAKNYNISFVKSNITIKKAPLSVKVNDITISYGTRIPKLKYTIDGFKLNETESIAFSQLPSIESESSEIRDVGCYKLNAQVSVPEKG